MRNGLRVVIPCDRHQVRSSGLEQNYHLSYSKRRYMGLLCMRKDHSSYPKPTWMALLHIKKRMATSSVPSIEKCLEQKNHPLCPKHKAIQFFRSQNKKIPQSALSTKKKVFRQKLVKLNKFYSHITQMGPVAVYDGQT